MQEATMTPEELFKGYENAIPEHTRAAIWNYAHHGLPPGSFLTAVLENDLLQAIAYADDDSVKALKPIAQVLYSRVPAGCYGSKAAIRDHMRAARANAGILWASYKEPASSSFVKGL